MTGNTYNEKIAAVSFLGALSVVLIHINVAAPMGTFSWWVYQLTANGFCRWAVPFFFAVSGYFLAARVDDKGWWKAAVCKRFRTLAVPYFIWNMVMAVYVLCLILIANKMAGRELTANMLKGWDILMYFGLHPVKGGHYGALWFIRSLFIYILISPLLVVAIRKIGWLIPIVLLVLGSVQWPSNFYLGWVMYFAAGIAARFRLIHVGKYFGLGVILGMSWIYFHKKYMLDSEITGCWDSTPLPAVVMVVVGIWSVMPLALKIPAFLLHATFPIYLLHFFFIRLFTCVFSQPRTTHWQIVEWIAVIGLSVMTSCLLRRKMPKVSMVVFGGR